MAVYDDMLAELEAGELKEIERRVFNALLAHPDGMTRPQLVAVVFGEVTKNLIFNNNTRDRKIRLAIAGLRKRLIPIVSSSGRAGYRLDTSREAREKMMHELISRRDQLNGMIQRAAKANITPQEYTEPVQASQPGLI